MLLCANAFVYICRVMGRNFLLHRTLITVKAVADALYLSSDPVLPCFNGNMRDVIFTSRDICSPIYCFTLIRADYIFAGKSFPRNFNVKSDRINGIFDKSVI